MRRKTVSAIHAAIAAVAIVIAIAAFIMLELQQLPALSAQPGLCQGADWCSALPDQQVWAALWRNWLERLAAGVGAPLLIGLACLSLVRSSERPSGHFGRA